MNNATDMLMKSAEIMFNLLTDKNMKADAETKIKIATANTLAQTIKTAIQSEILTLKINSTKANTAQLIGCLSDEI